MSNQSVVQTRTCYGQNPNHYPKQKFWLNAKMPEFRGNPNMQLLFVGALLGLLGLKFVILNDDVNYPGASAW